MASLSKITLLDGNTYDVKAIYASTSEDNTNTLHAVGVTSSATTTLKRNTRISFSGSNITAQLPNWDILSSPISDRSFDSFLITDDNNYSTSMIRVQQNTDNVVTTEIGTRRKYSASNSYFNTIRLGVSANGTRSVSVTGPAEWRTALGVNGLEWNASKLGSSSSSTATTIILPKSGTWLIISMHNSTQGLRHMWVARTGGNIIIQMDANTTVSINPTLSGTTMSIPKTTGGGADIYGIYLGS